MQADPYYPPRAGQLRRVMRPLWMWAVRLQRFRSGLAEPFERSRQAYPWILGVALIPELCMRLAVPGRWMLSTPAAWMGRLMLAGWGIGAAVFMGWMGRGIAELAYAAMISLHASSVIGFVSRAYPQTGVWRQVLQALGMVLLLGQGVYPAGLFLLERFVCIPVSIAGKVLVINCLPWASKGKVGDFVAFRQTADWGRGYRVDGGVSGGRILAAAGEEVRFGPEVFETPAGRFPRLYAMPREGVEKVAPDHWFLWSEVNASYDYLNFFGGQANGPRVSEEALSHHLMRISKVPCSKVIGKPFQYWLWRRQIE